MQSSKQRDGGGAFGSWQSLPVFSCSSYSCFCRRPCKSIVVRVGSEMYTDEAGGTFVILTRTASNGMPAQNANDCLPRPASAESLRSQYRSSNSSGLYTCSSIHRWVSWRSHGALVSQCLISASPTLYLLPSAGFMGMHITYNPTLRQVAAL